MYTTYKLNVNELDMSFIDGLKALFHNKDIEIAVCEATESTEDETAYLLKSPANCNRLLQAIENVKNNRNLVTIPFEELV